MIHFRLRRSIRLAAHLLFLSFAGSGVGPRSPRFALRGALASRSLTPDFSAAPLSTGPPASIAAFASHFFSGPKYTSHRLRHHTARYLALGALLLAVLLELCGCNPIAQFGRTPGTSSASKTPQEPRAEQNVFFYDPAEPVNASPEARIALTGLAIDTHPPSPEASPLPWAIPESVFFVYKSLDTSNQQAPPPKESRSYQQPLATTFVISVPDRTHDRFARFLVTARHVVDPRWAHCSEKNPASIDVRLNRRTGGVGYETVPLQSGFKRLFYTPADETADLAVIPIDRDLTARLDDYKFLDVPFRLLPTDSEMRQIAADQPIMTASLSSRPSGELRNYPVFDAGFLSQMSSKAVSVQCGQTQTPQAKAMPLHLWFISAGLLQGTSGAPVYASVVRETSAFKTPILLGVQSVVWPERGIAGITPSSVLSDLIRSSLSRNRPNARLHTHLYRIPDATLQPSPPSLY